ncbi:sterol desaturase family protein [Aureispira sp. CCB-QB1]|uniref:sterol desaturase family protein n=1 Tax=Aureispira sp. CCB-QB1 TaxID=1313421 RepID=UPI0009DEA756|nr:sterol desaturase family protein [Aureispira sp. CCB-QB1]
MMEGYIEWLSPFCEAITTGLGSFLDPKKRIYFPYLLSALLLSLIYLKFINPKTRSLSLAQYIKYLFSPKIWRHPSAIVDYKLLFFNHLIKILFITPYLLAHTAFAYIVVQAWEASIGIQDTILWNSTAINISYTISFLIISDFSRFILHYALHKIPFLWEFHKVHHAAEVLTPITLYRVHPIEFFLFRLRSLLVFGSITGSFFFWFRTGIEPLSILKIHAGIFLFNLIGANLRHSHIPISFGSTMERIFISPSQHQIHHSVEEQHYDKNFGSIFSIWDGLFGSLFISQPNKKLAFGIEKEEQTRFRSLWQNLFIPFKNIFRKLR